MKSKKIAFLVISAFGILLLCMFIVWSQTDYAPWNTGVIEKNNSIKYILQWTSANREPFEFMGKGHETFQRKKCRNINCFITPNRYLLGDVKLFDAILFHGPDILYYNKNLAKPQERSNQSYIFVSQESAQNYPATNEKYNGVFNFTWTYKLDSDISYKYIIVKDHEGRVIGPSKDIPWINVNDMMPINDSLVEKLSHKTKAAAWFVSACNALNKRREVAVEIKKELERHNMTVDIYGKCGNKVCPRSSMKECVQMLQRDYYFYFSFENSMSEDYVTEKLNTALQNYVVPIVYGGADYSRFMPDGIYLDAAKVAPAELAKQMVEIIQDKNKYYNFFKWHNHYSYHHPEEDIATDPYCLMCEFVNNIKNISIIENFQEWWNPNNRTSKYLYI